MAFLLDWLVKVLVDRQQDKLPMQICKTYLLARERQSSRKLARLCTTTITLRMVAFIIIIPPPSS